MVYRIHRQREREFVMGRQTDGETEAERQTGRPTDIQMDRQTDRNR